MLFVCIRYQDYQASDIPVVDKDGVKVRVMAGESYGTEGPIKVSMQLRLLTLCTPTAHRQPLSCCTILHLPFWCEWVRCDCDGWYMCQGCH